MEHAVTFRIMVFLIGALISGYLVYLFLYKHFMLHLALVGASLLAWFSGLFLLTGLVSVFETVSATVRNSLMVFACAGMLFDSPFLLHALAGYVRDHVDVSLPGWTIPAIYVPCLIVLYPVFFVNGSSVSSLLNDPLTLWTVLLVKTAYVFCISAVSWWFSRRTQHRDVRYFTVRFPLFLLASLAFVLGVFLSAGHEHAVLTTLAYGAPVLPVLFFLWTVHRYQLLSVEITERTVFAFSAVLTIFLYFFVIRHAGSLLERYYDVNTEALEIVLFLVVIVLLTVAGRWAMKLTGYRFRRKSYRVLDALADRLSSTEIDRERGIRLVAEKLQEAFEAPAEVLRKETDPVLFEYLPDRPERPLTVLDRDREELVRELRDRNGRVMVPLSDEDGVLALVILGQRRNYLSYTPGEREAVSLVMRQFREAVRNHDLIREQVSLERRLQQDEKLEALGNVAASCAHEVKNPLSSINGIVANMMEELDENDQHRRDVEVIKEEIDRLSAVVRRILDFARKGEDRTKRVDVTELVDSVAYVLGKSPEGVRLEKRIPEQPVFVRVVESDLKGILFNLLRNAIEASPRGEKVRVDVEPAGDHVEISITNSGPGPDEGVIERIRERDTAGKIGRRDAFGLAIVLDQLERMDGSLDVEAEDETTSFIVRLPRTGKEDGYE